MAWLCVVGSCVPADCGARETAFLVAGSLCVCGFDSSTGAVAAVVAARLPWNCWVQLAYAGNVPIVTANVVTTIVMGQKWRWRESGRMKPPKLLESHNEA
jgi:uncharacterized membrane protein